MALDPKQRRIVIIGSGIVILALLYRYYMSRQAASNTGTPSDTAGLNAAQQSQDAADYASLSGQEQSDAAALQGQLAQLQGQEQGDVAGLFGGLAGQGAQEQADVSGLTGGLGAVTQNIDALGNAVQTDLAGQAKINQTIPRLSAGVDKLNRGEQQENAIAQITPHKGKAFYNYYKKTTGKAPPAHVAVNNVIYQAWKQGLNLPAHAAQHPSAKSKQIAHPNPNHKPTNGRPHPQAPASHKVAPPHRGPLPRPRPVAHEDRPRTSGRRR